MTSSIQQPSNRVRQVARGFTLVELIIAVCILSILVAIALPSFREMSIRMTITSTTNDIVGALNLARSESVKRGRWASVASKSGGQNWRSGWSVNVLTDPPETLRKYAKLDAGYKVTASDGSSGSGEIIFRSTGSVVDSGGTSFFINVCRPTDARDPTQSRVVEIKPNGSITSYRDTTNSPAPRC